MPRLIFNGRTFSATVNPLIAVAHWREHKKKMVVCSYFMRHRTFPLVVMRLCYSNSFQRYSAVQRKKIIKMKNVPEGTKWTDVIVYTENRMDKHHQNKLISMEATFYLTLSPEILSKWREDTHKYTLKC